MFESKAIPRKELTAEQIEYLEAHYNKDVKPNDIAKDFGMGVATLRKRMREEGLHHLLTQYKTKWTPEKIEWLKVNFNLPYAEMSTHLGLCDEQIRLKINELKLERTRKHRPFKIDPEDTEFLNDLKDPTLTAPDIVQKYAEKYGIGESRIHQMRKELRIKLQVNTLSRESSAEKRVREILDELDLVYQQERRVGRYSIDFYLGQRLCIEVHGDYWHSQPRRVASDKRKREHLEALGYKILYIWESQLDRAREDILDFLANLGLPTARAVDKNLVNPSKRGVRRVKRRANGERGNPNTVPHLL